LDAKFGRNILHYLHLPPLPTFPRFSRFTQLTVLHHEDGVGTVGQGCSGVDCEALTGFKPAVPYWSARILPAYNMELSGGLRIGAPHGETVQQRAVEGRTIGHHEHIFRQNETVS